MNLNQENDDEFGPISDEPKTIVASTQPEDNAAVPDSDIFSSAAVKGELPTFNAVFVLQDEKANNTRDLVEVHDTLKANGCVSCEDANTIEALAPGFISEENPLGFFSTEPTKTRYKETMLSVAGTLDRQYEELRNLIVGNAASFWKISSEHRERMQPQFVQCLIEVNRAVAKALHVHDREEPEQIPYIFNNRKRLADFLRAPSSTIFGDCIVEAGGAPTHGFEGTMVAGYIDQYLKILMGRRDLIATLEVALSVYDERYVKLNGQFYTFDNGILNTVFNVEGNYNSFTVGGIVAAIGSNRMRNYVKRLDEMYLCMQNYFQEVPTLVDAIEKKEDLTIAQKLEAISEISAKMHENQALMCALLENLGGVFGLLRVTTCLFEELA